MDSLYSKLFLYIVIILSATFHEFAHGWMAYRLGDETAKDQGRLTLNPLKHIDPLGTFFIPLFLLFTSGFFIGWAKPVPYNPFNLRDRKYGSLKVGIAGPAANIIIALILGLTLRFFAGSLVDFSPVFAILLAFIVNINIWLALFNLIPLPPLDGSKILFDLFPNIRYELERVSLIGPFLALLIAFYILPYVGNLAFNLIVGTNFYFLGGL